MAETSTMGLYDRGFGRWLERNATRWQHRLTGHFSEYWTTRRDTPSMAHLWRIDERDLLRAEIDRKDIIALRAGRGAASPSLR